jgi:steroid delta-isomerase-like uncharacterized protein
MRIVSKPIGCWIIALLLSIPLQGQSDKDAGHSNEAILEAFITTLNHHDVEQFSNLFHASCLYVEVNSGRTYTSREAIAEYIGRTIEGIPDSQFEILHMMANEELGMVEWVWKGTNTVGYPQMGIPATGKYMELNGVSIMEFHDGKIHRNWDYWDTDSFMKKIGAR